MYKFFKGKEILLIYWAVERGNTEAEGGGKKQGNSKGSALSSFSPVVISLCRERAVQKCSSN